MKYTVFNTEFGYASIFEESGRLKEFFLPVERYDEAVNRVKVKYPDAMEEETDGLSRAAAMTKAYFGGETVDFRSLKAGFEGLSDFTLSVFECTRKIPYGATISYSELAKKAGAESAARAAGSALHKNPLPVIIPCHRVIKNSGELGGYSAGAGWKIRLLKLEKIL